MRFTSGRFESVIVGVMLVTGFATGCASANTQLSPDSSFPVMVTVHNRQWSDLRLYVIDGSSRYPLGAVTALMSATFRLPRGIRTPSELHFLAVPMDGDSQATESIIVAPGEALVFNVGSTQGYSTLMRRR
jgi:hypothetical protein